MSSPVVNFHGPNPGVQVGVNHGSISTISADILNELPIVSGALFDSFENQNEDVCLSGTRTQILQQITTWATSPGPPIFWLKGMAGTGKSTISRTLSKSFAGSNLLGASFFFKTGERSRGSAVSLFPTLVRQLVVAFPMISPAVQEALHAHPRVWEKALSVQFNELLLHPLQSLKSPDPPTAVLVIDALDECDDDTNIATIIRLLPQLRSVEAMRVRIFLTSRPELPIRLGFSRILDQHQDFALHEVREIEIKHDISLFFEHRVAKIREDNDLPDGWPGRENIHQLVNISVPLFIFAVTACRLLEEYPWDVAEVLADMLICGDDGSKLNWKHQLNGTYLPVLNRFIRRQGGGDKSLVFRDFQRIIGSIVLLESPLSVNALAELLDMRAEKVKWRLRSFHSVLNIHDDDDSAPIRLFHLSFREFLLDPETSNLTQLSVDEKSTHRQLSELCMSVCRRNLKENMCHLDPGTGREEIDTRELHKHLSPALQYSCRCWVHHLVRGNDTEADDIHLFLKEFFLHWMEAMGIIGSASQVIRDLNLLQSISSGLRHGELNNFIHDAKRFALRNAQIAHEAPLQLYYSGLLFAPKMSIVRKCFERRLPSWMKLNSEHQGDWGAELQTIEGHRESVDFVALSEDDQTLVSLSSLDNTIRVWDAMTGVLQRIWDVADSHWINSIVLSPNGRYLATIGPTISLWDLSMDVRPRMLNGQRAAFYRGNEFLVVAEQLTVRFLNIESGILTEIQLEQGDHFNEIISYGPPPFKHNENEKGLPGCPVLSADGQIIAAICDWTPMILVWETSTGRERRGIWNNYGIWNYHAFGNSPNRQHTFSGQSQILATVPPNGDFIYLWNIDTTDLKRAIQIEQHSSPLWITISSDSQLLAFVSRAVSSSNSTIQVWEIDSGTLRHVFLNPGGLFHSLAFSHDCQFLASGTGDHLIKLWDISSYLKMSETPKAPSRRVERVVFSPDGSLIATITGARHEITVWNAKSGNVLSIFPLPARSDHSPIELAISPNNQRLAVLVLAFNDSHQNPLGKPQGPVAPLMIWEFTTNDLWKIDDNHCWSYEGAAFRPPVFSPDSDSLALICGYGSVRVYDTITKTIVVALEPTSIAAVAFAIFVPFFLFSRDGEVLAYRDQDVIQIWNMRTGTLRKLFRFPTYNRDYLGVDIRQNPTTARDFMHPMHQTSRYNNDLSGRNPVRCGTFSPDGRYLVFALFPNVIEIWDVNSGKLLQMAEYQTGSEEIADIVFNRGGLTLMTLLGPREVVIKSEEWEPEWEPQGPNLPVDCRVTAVRADGWVYMRGRRVLWLPHRIRPDPHSFVKKLEENKIHTLSFHGNSVALGSLSGDVTILEFDSDCAEASI